MDYALVQRLRDQVAEQLRTLHTSRAEQGMPELSWADQRMWGRSAVARTVASYRTQQLQHGKPLPTAGADDELAEAVYAALFGLGRLEPLINNPDLINIEIVGCDRVWLTHADLGVRPGEPVADTDAELIDWVRRIATYSGLSSRAFDPAHPFLDVRLPDGSRLNATMSVVERPVVSIRLFRLQQVTLDDLRTLGAFTEQVQSFLAAAVRARHNLMISGETFAGKTTLLRALGNEIEPAERIVTCEHFHELGFHLLPDAHPQVVALEERLPNSEGHGGITVHDLVDRSRRMNPDRIIVGEVVGGEVIAMLDAMTQGNDGSLSTIHARHPRQVFDRIATYALRSAERLPVEAAHRLAAGGLDFVVHLAKRRLPDGRVHRYIQSVLEVIGYDGLQVVTSEIFTAARGADPARPKAAISEHRLVALADAGHADVTWAREAYAP